MVLSSRNWVNCYWVKVSCGNAIMKKHSTRFWNQGVDESIIYHDLEEEGVGSHLLDQKVISHHWYHNHSES